MEPEDPSQALPAVPIEESGDVARPLIFVPVEAQDFIRQRRRQTTLVCVLLILAAATAGFVYRRTMDPLHAEESYDAGLRLLRIARYQQAILAFDRTASLEPDYAEAYLMRGRAFVADSQIERGSRDFSKYIELRPNDPQPLIDRGQAYIEMHDYQAAMEDANKAIELDNTFAAAFNLRGCTIRAMGNARAALKDFDRAVELAPVEINYFERAATYQILGEHRDAIADLTELIAFRPDFAPGYFARAKSERAVGDVKRAEEDHHIGRALDGH